MKMLTLYLLLVLITLHSYKAQSTGADTYIKLFNEGNYKDVVSLLKDVDSAKLNAEKYFYLAQSLYSLKEVMPAISSYKKAVNLNPQNIGYQLNLAHALNFSGNTEEAINCYLQIIKEDSANTAALSDLGNIYLVSKNYLSAKEIFSKLISINENDYLGHYNYALSVYNMNTTQPDTEIIPTHLNISLIYNPKFANAREMLANYYFIKQQYKDALFTYEQLSFIRNNDSDVYYKMGLCLEKMKYYHTAIHYYERAVKYDSTVANYNSHLGYCYYVKGRMDSAITAYKRASLYDKDNPTVYQNMGMAYLQIDSLDAARNSFDQSLEKFGLTQMAFIINQIVFINLKQGKLDEAKADCEKVLAIEPENVYANFNMARIYDEQKKNNLAAKLYKKSMELMKDNSSMENEMKFAVKRIKELEGRRG